MVKGSCQPFNHRMAHDKSLIASFSPSIFETTQTVQAETSLHLPSFIKRIRFVRFIRKLQEFAGANRNATICQIGPKQITVATSRQASKVIEYTKKNDSQFLDFVDYFKWFCLFLTCKVVVVM